MVMKKVFLVAFSLLLFVAGSYAGPGKTIKDTVISCGAFSASYAFQLPGGDLAKRFGPNSNAGASAWYKTDRNFFYNVSWSYIFGQQLTSTTIFDSIATVDGFVIDREGKYADVRIFERGFTLGVNAGKLFPMLGPNPNCGLLTTVGLGWIQHKYRIYDNGARTPQLSKEYLKGYDRLTGGLAVTEFVGYWFMSNNRFVNFYAGIEATQGFTKSLRSWDYTLMKADTERRMDLLWGVRVGWVIPIYQGGGKEYYYNY